MKKKRRTSSLQGEALLRSIDVLNNQLTNRASSGFLRAIHRATNSPDIERIIKEIRAGRGLSKRTQDLIDGIELDIDMLHDLYGEAYLKGGRAASRVYSDVVRFDPRNPRVLEIISTTGLARINEISRSTRDSYRRTIIKGIQEGLSTQDIAADIKSNLGLTFRQSQAVSSMRQRLFAQGMPRGRANRRAADYAQTLLQQRAETIAETEMTHALEQGKIEYWTQALNGGLLGRDEVVVWVTEEDERVDEPCAVREGMEVPLIAFQQHLIDSPPLHPRCRCQWILGSGKTKSNRATLPTDRRLTGGQTTNRFVNPMSGHIMGKTETGDVYESLLNITPDARRILERRFNGRLVQITERGTTGRLINAPVDFEIIPYDGSRPFAIEVKTMHRRSGNLKSAIKKPEYARKIAYVLDDPRARALVRGMDDNNPADVQRVQNLLNDMVDEIGGMDNLPKRPVIVAQVVDDTTLASAGGKKVFGDSVSAELYAYVGDFPSKAISRYEKIGSYATSSAQLEEAVIISGHGGIKIPRRALKQILDGIDDIDDFAWHPLTTRDGQVNKPLSFVLDSIQSEAAPTLGNRTWYHVSTGVIDFDPVGDSIKRRTNDLNAHLGLHMTSDRTAAARIHSASPQRHVLESRVEMHNPKVYGESRDKLGRRKSWTRSDGAGRSTTAGISQAEIDLDADMFRFMVREDLLDLIPDTAYGGRMEDIFMKPPHYRFDTVDTFTSRYPSITPEFMRGGSFTRVLMQLADEGYDPIDILDELMDIDLTPGLLGSARDIRGASINTTFARLPSASQRRIAHLFKADLAERGYDGIVYWNTTETVVLAGKGNWSVIVFNERQIQLKPLWEMTKKEFDRIRIPGMETTRRKVVAEARPLDGIINLGSGYWRLSLAERKRVLLHEAGHSLEHRVMGELRFQRAWSVIPKESRNGYVLSVRSDAEALAEAFARLWDDPIAFKRELPQAYKFISSVADQFDFPVPSSSPGFTPRLRKFFKSLRRKTWTCGTEPTRFPDQWNEDIVDGEWYTEFTGRSVRLIPLTVDVDSVPGVRLGTNELHF